MMREHGGTITLADLDGYRVRTVQPLTGMFRGHEILAMPPPSSGGIAMLQTFGILSNLFGDLGFVTHNSSPYVHVVAEALKHAFADRSRWLADPDFADLPLEAMLADETLRAAAKTIDLNHTKPPDAYGVLPLAEDGGTSHLSVVDSTGMAVACTETINLTFGSLVCVPGFGFCLNNEMDDFTTVRGEANAFGLRQSDANLPEPGKRPLSSMSPTIVLRNGKPVIVAGGSGGPRIITATTQCILNVMMFHMQPEEAVSSPRFHHQWAPNTLLFDKRWQDAATIAQLKARGHETGVLTSEAVVQMITVDAEGTIRAASDPRKGGKPAGW
jgi:gamma-glutamyltranspeptidase/glutathione hydrolase